MLYEVYISRKIPLSPHLWILSEPWKWQESLPFICFSAGGGSTKYVALSRTQAGNIMSRVDSKSYPMDRIV